MAEVEDLFSQNEENAKRFKSGQKRKQPGSVTTATTISTTTTTSSTGAPSHRLPSASPTSPTRILASPTSPKSNSHTNGLTKNRSNSNSKINGGMVYQQPKSLQHHPLPSQPLKFDPSVLTDKYSSESFQHYRSNSTTSIATSIGRRESLSTEATDVTSRNRYSSNSSVDAKAGSFLDFPPPRPKKVNVVNRTSVQDIEGIASMLAETTLNNVAYFGANAAMVTNTFDEEDLWGAQLGAFNTAGDVLVPEELQILPDPITREQLTDLYYKNHYSSLPMVQREVLRVCQENVHIPHCLLLCNAVYYCGSMYSPNAITLRRDVNDEGSVGEDFFLRGQGMLEKKYLTTHICTVQALLLFAIGHKSQAQRSAFISQAITMALDMGLHNRLDDSVNPYVRAYRARTFWCCYLFDSTASAINGKPGLINDEEIGIDMFTAGELGPESETFSDQYIIHCLHGWQLCRRIRKNTNLITRASPPPRSVLQENLSRLDSELVEWQRNLPKVFEFVPFDGCIVSNISRLSACAQLLCYALIILLHHPYLPSPKCPEAFQPPAPGQPDSQGYCTQAAKEITKIGGILLKEAPRTFEQHTPSRYSLNFAVRIHLRNAKCTTDPNLAKESRRDLQKTMDYIERVENLQFFRINRSKKSEVADLLASCRSALAQHKSSLDLAKEAAALKHRQILEEKQEQQRRERQKQQQQQETLPQPILASQKGPPLYQDGQSTEDASPSQILLSMQAKQQHPNLKNQTYMQQQLHLQMYTQERNQQELARLNQLQRHGQLELDHQRHQHFQQMAMAKHKQQIFMQQQQAHSPQMFRTNNAYHPSQHPHQAQQQVLQKQQQQQQHTGYPFAASGAGDHLQQQMMVISNGGHSQATPASAPYGAAGLPVIDFQDPAAFASLTPEQQQQLFISFSQSLNSGNNTMCPLNAPGNTGGNERGQGTNGAPLADHQQQQHANLTPLTLSSQAQAHVPTSSSAAIYPTVAVHNSMNGGHGMMENFFLQSSNPGVTVMDMDSHSFGDSVGAAFSSLNGMHHHHNHHQQQQQQHHNHQHRPSFDNISTSGLRLGSPESATSPGSITEDAILQSWSITTFHDHIYMNPNHARDDPRNDYSTFMYLPSEFEYGDAPALSPGASSTGGGGPGSVSNGSGTHGSGSEGSTSPRLLL
ncbi:hypothetical protein EC957_006408 [Mortierella hygrophila]|uniref:Xylanolytic transcriptional activator regulatory domain-containing protein n=1 Tax=Mortierella hygrophila TaxID=979708 RepID=A0A9P6EZ11_9FUNG|nr:hypothetical protein EC957_006408 [Mortierella hygrophila]